MMWGKGEGVEGKGVNTCNAVPLSPIETSFSALVQDVSKYILVQDVSIWIFDPDTDGDRFRPQTTNDFGSKSSLK
jgi:hypothetical protein